MCLLVVELYHVEVLKCPTPDANPAVEDDTTDFEKTLKENMPKEDISMSANSAEESILRKIKNK